MRIASKNRFSKVVIKKSRYSSFGISLKPALAGSKTDLSKDIIKPIKGAGHVYDHQIIAGSAL